MLNPKPEFARGTLGVGSHSHCSLPSASLPAVSSCFPLAAAALRLDLRSQESNFSPVTYTSSFSGALQFLIGMHSPHSEIILSFGAHSKMLLTAQVFGPRRLDVALLSSASATLHCLHAR